MKKVEEDLVPPESIKFIMESKHVLTTLENYPNTIQDFTVDGKCSNCGGCCSSLLPLSDSEIKDIQKYVNKHHITDCRTELLDSNVELDLRCPFRDEVKKKCAIYQVRPRICRMFICNDDAKSIERNRNVLYHRWKPFDMNKFLKEDV